MSQQRRKLEGTPDFGTLPVGICMEQAYENIRYWCRHNLPLLRQGPGGGEYARRCEALVAALPSATELNDLELRAVLGEVLYGYLEWACHQTDGHYQMAAYALGALEAAGVHWSLNDAERRQLRDSVLWPYLTLSRDAAAP